MPALQCDELHTMTVLPYLIAYHYGSDENSQFVTAQQLNGNLVFDVVLPFLQCHTDWINLLLMCVAVFQINAILSAEMATRKTLEIASPCQQPNQIPGDVVHYLV